MDKSFPRRSAGFCQELNSAFKTISRTSEPFSSAVDPQCPGPRGSQPRELPIYCRNQKGIQPIPGFERPQLSKGIARPVPKLKNGGVLLPPGFDQCQMSKRGRTESDNPAEFQRFGHYFANFDSGTLRRTHQRVSMSKQPVGALRRDTYNSFDIRGPVQARCRSEVGVACPPGQGSTDLSHPDVLELQGLRTAASFIETKASFMGMWIRLEKALQNHESVLVKMKEEIGKSSVDLKTAKDVALKEREELKAECPRASKALETVSEQARKAKRLRENFEHFSTDLSVQLAELNRIQQQVQEQQAAFEALMKLKTHNEAQERSESVEFETESMSSNLQEFETRLGALEAELNSNKLASEQLEQVVLKSIARLKDFDEVFNSQQECISYSFV